MPVESSVGPATDASDRAFSGIRIMMRPSSGERFLSKEDWAKESKGLPVLSRSESFEHVVVGIQAVGPEYFTNDDVQHCILERPDKTRYVVPY
jgi:hypothetical protein